MIMLKYYRTWLLYFILNNIIFQKTFKWLYLPHGFLFNFLNKKKEYQ